MLHTIVQHLSLQFQAVLSARVSHILMPKVTLMYYFTCTCDVLIILKRLNCGREKCFCSRKVPFQTRLDVWERSQVQSGPLKYCSWRWGSHQGEGRGEDHQLCSAQTVHVVWSGWVIVWEVITHSKSINIYFSILFQMSCVIKSVWFLTQKSLNFMKTHFLMEIAAFYKKSPLSYKKNTHGLLIKKLNLWYCPF